MREKKRSSHTFHLTFAIQILQEYQRRSTEWEQQCIQYQKQLATMETQNKSLTDEIDLTHESKWQFYRCVVKAEELDFGGFF